MRRNAWSESVWSRFIAVNEQSHNGLARVPKFVRFPHDSSAAWCNWGGVMIGIPVAVINSFLTEGEKYGASCVRFMGPSGFLDVVHDEI